MKTFFKAFHTVNPYPTVNFPTTFNRIAYSNVIFKYELKGQCHAIFDPRFFHQSIHPRALIHGLKPFRKWLRFCREIRNIHLKWLASGVSMRPRKRIRQFQGDRGSGFSSLNKTTESFMTLQKPSQKLILAINFFTGILYQNKHICKHYCKYL
jgi:hypothetical protein